MDKILYHGKCRDGFCAAWVLSKKYPNAEFIPVYHNDEPPPELHHEDDVLIVDYAYDRVALLEIYANVNSLHVLDHHKRMAEELEGLDFCCFDMTESGASLAWKYVNPYNPKRDNPPDLVRFTKDKDLWLWELPDSQAVNAAIASYPMTFETYDKLNEMPLYYLIKEGEAILRYQAQLINEIMDTKVEVEINGIKGAAVNSPVLQSEMGHLLVTEGYPFGIAWMQEPDSQKFSIRSKTGELDVSELAKKLGGGGHPSSSGFRIQKEAVTKLEPKDED